MITPEEREINRVTEALYNDKLKCKLEKDHMHEYVVIDPDSGDYFLGKTISEATMQADKAHPGRIGHLMRVGHRAAYQIGGYSLDRHS